MQIYWYAGSEAVQPEELVKHANLAEKAGFDGMMVSEHFHPWVDDTGASGFAFSTIAAAAMVTSRLQFVTAVTTPLWRFHPAIVAQAAATLSRLSRGRFALGVGTGHFINEGPLGFAPAAYAEKSKRMAEALTIMRDLLDGKTSNFHGDFYQTDHAKLYSPPLVRVPIYMAAAGPKSATLAAEKADGLIISVKDPEQAVADVKAPAQAAARANGRPKPLVLASTWSMLTGSPAETAAALAPWRGLRAPSRSKLYDPLELQREADRMDQEEILSKFNVVRGPRDYVRIYGRLVATLAPDVLGIQTSSADLAATIEMLGRDVLPVLRSMKDKEE